MSAQLSLPVLEQQTFEQEDYAEIPPSDIVAYNELRSCADLFRMHEQGILNANPDFQRDVVWKAADQTRFIDSLVKQLPIPSMCFAQDYKMQKWIVIDGLQRISSIVRFLSGGDWVLSALDDVDPGLSGKPVAAIKISDPKLRHFYTRVENLSIPITVLRCEFSKKSHMEFLFTIFHRLNTGGMKLNNQEIRNCIYGGSFNALLKQLDLNDNWRRLNKMSKGNSYRFAKQEIILRLFAFHDRHKSYDGHLAKFLNSYMHENRELAGQKLDQKRELFKETAEIVFDKIFEKKAPQKLSITVLESTLVGVSKNLSNLKTAPAGKLKKLYEDLTNDHEFSDDALREGLAKRNRVIARLDAAIAIFAK
jgi:uncharacterized protein with ParB-like and HNH nuclease domain